MVVSDFENEEEVIERANDTVFGLSGAVFSQDINRAIRVAGKIHSGTVCINCCMMIDHNVPFGGMKQSGWGRELGKVRNPLTARRPRGSTDSKSFVILGGDFGVHGAKNNVHQVGLRFHYSLDSFADTCLA